MFLSSNRPNNASIASPPDVDPGYRLVSDEGYVDSRLALTVGLLCLAAVATGVGPLAGFRSEIRGAVPQVGPVFDEVDRRVSPIKSWVKAKFSAPKGTAASDEQRQAACIASLSPAVKAGQLIMPSLRAEDLSGGKLSATAAILRAGSISNVIIMSDLKDPLTINNLKQKATVAGMPTFVFVDEEGGSVQRIKSAGTLPSQQDVASSKSPKAAQKLVAAHAEELKRRGFDGVFGPVVDVLPVDGRTALGGKGRMFSSDPDTVASYAEAYASAWSGAGIFPVFKHFPGHGSATGDTHNGAATTPPLSVLQQRDLLPYKQLAATPHAGVMMGHLNVPGLTEPNTPASLSPKATQYARSIMGKETPLFTDSLQMGAVNPNATSQARLTLQALKAGNDIAVNVYDGPVSAAELKALSTAVTAAVQSGELPSAQVNESVQRVFAMKRVSACTVAAALQQP